MQFKLLFDRGYLKIRKNLNKIERHFSNHDFHLKLELYNRVYTSIQSYFTYKETNLYTNLNIALLVSKSARALIRQ